MSFMCCCCSRRDRDEVTANDEKIEVARDEDDNSLCDFDGRDNSAIASVQGNVEIVSDDDSNDSFDAESFGQAHGHPGDKPTQYVSYLDDRKLKGAPKGIVEEKSLYLMSLLLQNERASFLAKRDQFAASVLRFVNQLRLVHGSLPLLMKPELDQLAQQLWKDRVRILDGFVAVPRCTYFPREVQQGQRFGCLTYYTPRSARVDRVPRAMVHFWRNAGVPRIPTSRIPERKDTDSTNAERDFPSAGAGEVYVANKPSLMDRAFEHYRKDFPAQLLARECKFMGLHADMVQMDEKEGVNVICVAAVFDFVASSKGRNMKALVWATGKDGSSG